VRIRTPHRLYDDATLSLRGRHQVENAILAVRVLEEAGARGLFEIPPAAIHTALTDVTWPARLELLPWQGGTVILDGAHNPSGASALASYLDENYSRRVPVVFGVMRDKRAGAMIAALVPVASHLIVTAAASDRAMPIAEIASVAAEVAPVLPVHRAATPAEAMAVARALGDPVVVAGSLHLAGEVRAHLLT
jgi:dihydrofolate synthase/folylpolyglutamate synthase